MSDQPIAEASSYTQHRKTRTDMHALSGIRTEDHSDQAVKTYDTVRAATGTEIHLRHHVQNVLEQLIGCCDRTDKKRHFREWSIVLRRKFSAMFARQG
jgi:phage terminase large subunit-like protein